jgi:hypothetical protein
MRTRPLCAIALVALLVAGSSVSASARVPAGVKSTNTIVSSGVGRQTFEGAGLAYGVLAPGGDVRIVDLSSNRDGKFTVTAQVPATAGSPAQSVSVKPVKLLGVFVYRLKPTRQNLSRNLAFSVAGSKFRLVLEGQSTLNGAGVSGSLKLEGAGTVSVNGQTPPVEWTTAGRLTLPTKAAAAAAKPATTTKTTTTATTTTS